jgi:hypothetical protein
VHGGTTFVVTGGGGISLDAQTVCPPGTPEPAAAVQAHHFLALHASAATLSLRAIDVEGTLLDDAVVSRK